MFIRTTTLNLIHKSVCLLLVLLLLTGNAVLSYGEICTLSPELGFTHSQTMVEMHAALICELIEKRSKLWEGKSIEDIYADDMLLWQQEKIPYLNLLKPVLSVDKTEITIEIPYSDITIRYYDASPEKNLTLLPNTDLSKIRTQVINSRINRQIIKRSEPLPQFDTGSVEVKKLTKEFALENKKILCAINNQIYGANWVPEQIASDLWEKGTYGLKEDRVFHAKWDHSYISVNEKDEICGMLIAYERPAGELQGVNDVSVYIHSMVVDEPYRRMGLASKMMNTLAADLCKKGYRVLHGPKDVPTICLQTGTDNLTAQKFYKKMGFRVVGEKTYPEHVDQVLLAKSDHVYELSAKSPFQKEKNNDIELVFFDWDGTIVDTTDKSLDNFAMVNSGLFKDKEEAVNFAKKYLHGRTVPETFEILKIYADERGLIFPYEDAIDYGNKLDENRMKLIDGDIPVVKGSIELIKCLKEGGAKVYICSAMNIKGLKRQIDKVGVRGLFDGIHGSPSSSEDDFLTKGEYIKKVIEENGCSKGRTFMVGDTLFDMEAAEFAGIQGIGRAKNVEKEEELISSGAIFCVSDYGNYEQIIKRIKLDIKIKNILRETSIDIAGSISAYTEQFRKADFSDIDELKIIANMFTPEENDILMREPVQAILSYMVDIIRPLSQADVLAEVDELVQYCSGYFVPENISPNILIRAYLNRSDISSLIPRPAIGPILGKALAGVSSEKIKDTIILPLIEKMNNTGKRYKYCDIFNEIASQMPVEVNTEIFQEVVQTLLREIDNADYAVIKALNTIFNKSNIFKHERDLLEKGIFDPENELMCRINYVLWGNRVHAGNFNEYPHYSAYLKAIKDLTKIDEFSIIDKDIEPDMRAVVYEAYLAREKMIQINNRAKELGRELFVIENLSYGAVSLAPITEERMGVKYITGTDIKVVSTKIASSGRQGILTSFLPFSTMKEIATKQPMVIVVDGTTNLFRKSTDIKTVHMPCAFTEYKEYMMVVNKALTGKIDPKDFYSISSEIEKIKKDKEFNRVKSFYSHYSSTGKKPYKIFYWYPGKMKIDNNIFGGINKISDVDVLAGPSMIFMQTVNDIGSLDALAKEYIDGEYVPGGFDDTSYFKGFKFVYDGKSPPKLSNDMTEISRRMFKEFCEKYDIKIKDTEKKKDEGFVDQAWRDTAFIGTLLRESRDKIILRVPIEAIEAAGKDTLPKVISYLNSFQRTANGYIELFYMTGTGQPGAEDIKRLNNRFSINYKKLPAGFEKSNKNTITLFALLKGQEFEISDDPVKAKRDMNRIIKSNLGYLEPQRTQIVPVGLQNDPLGILRSAVMGLQMLYIARYKEFKKDLSETIDKEFISRFVDPAVKKYKALCLSYGITDFNFTGIDLIDLASGKWNDRIKALKKLIDLLPIESLDPEEIRRIYEQAEAALIYA